MRRPTRIQRFRRSRGAAAVEFAIIAVPFIALLFAIIESGLVYFAGQTMETAVANTARLIRTGQVQDRKLDAGDFKDMVCAQVVALFDCAAGLRLEVRTIETFDKVDLARPLDEAGNLKTDFVWDPGRGGDIVVVRAFYEWPTFVSLLGFNLSNMPNGTHLLSATTAFKNEPFPW